MKKRITLLGVTVIVLAGLMSFADSDDMAPAVSGGAVAVGGPAGPRLVPFQGLLTNLAGSPVSDGSYNLTFTLYADANSSIPHMGWTETHNGIGVAGGRFSVLLGTIRSLDNPDNDPLTADAVSFGQPLYLGIKVNADAEMRPRKQLVPAVHARQADNSDTLGGQTPGQLAPTGTIVAYGGTVAPDGWLLCNGTTVDRTTFANLFGVISTRFGIGNGTTTFGLPDMRGQFPLGWDPAVAGRPIGERAAAVAPAITVLSAGSHTHTMPANTGAIGLFGTDPDFLYAVRETTGFVTNAHIDVVAGGSTSEGNHFHSLSGLSTGSSGSHNHSATATAGLPEHLTVNYIIKY